MDGLRERISPSSTDLQSKKLSALPELAADLVRLKVDLIVTAGGPPALAAKKATTTHPHRDGDSPRILWAKVWLPVWRGREAMSPGCSGLAT